MATDLTQARRAPAAIRAMTDAAQRFLDGLSDEQRAKATFPFVGDERYFWHYTPIDRNGLPIKEMDGTQRETAFALMATGLSEAGNRTARQIIDLEPILKEAERLEGRTNTPIRDSERYWFSIFGTPGSPEAWAWRVGGHHIGISFTVVDGDYVAATPLFFGANPVEVRHGPHLGMRTLLEEEDLARRLLGSLDDDQKSVAIVRSVAPDDILTENFRKVDPDLPPDGIRYVDLSGEQRGHLVDLVRHYVTRATGEVSDGAWAGIERDGLESIGFAWAGPEAPGEGHYYAVKGAGFLIEYDNTQNDANHIHSVWRDYENDWGEDLLAAHYAATHSNGDHHH